MSVYIQRARYLSEFYLVPTISITNPVRGYWCLMLTIGSEAIGIGVKF